MSRQVSLRERHGRAGSRAGGSEAGSAAGGGCKGGVRVVGRARPSFMTARIGASRAVITGWLSTASWAVARFDYCEDMPPRSCAPPTGILPVTEAVTRVHAVLDTVDAGPVAR